MSNMHTAFTLDSAQEKQAEVNEADAEYLEKQCCPPLAQHFTWHAWK